VKLAKVIEMRRRGVDLAVVLDTVEQAQAVAKASRESSVPFGADRNRL
jgi:D-serine deaminase-like pyridoxal phosphate-dependent protein